MLIKFLSQRINKNKVTGASTSRGETTLNLSKVNQKYKDKAITSRNINTIHIERDKSNIIMDVTIEDRDLSDAKNRKNIRSSSHTKFNSKSSKRISSSQQHALINKQSLKYFYDRQALKN